MKPRELALGFALATFLALAMPLHAAETVHLYIKANGHDIQGESTQLSLGRENSIECVSYEQQIAAQREGKRIAYGPFVIRKRIDKASPLLLKALMENQVVEGRFWFFRPNPVGDGTTEMFYAVEFKRGRIDSVKQIVPDTIIPASSSDPPLEEVTISVASIKFTYTNGGITSEDNWTNGGATTRSLVTSKGDTQAPPAQESGQAPPASDNAQTAPAVDASAVPVGTWVYAGDDKKAINVTSIATTQSYFDGGGAPGKQKLIEAKVSIRNDNDRSWGNLTRSTYRVILLDSEGRTIGTEYKAYYVATGKEVSAHEFQKGQRLDFVYDIAYDANLSPATLVLKAGEVNLNYKIP